MRHREPSEGIPLIPAITDQSGRYAHVTEDGREWEYVYDVQRVGTRSECRVGQLRVHGLQREIDAAKPGDHIQTPWGEMRRVRDGQYARGFLLDQPGGPASGTLLSVPVELLARAGTWTARVGSWSYAVAADQMGSKSERRIGRLRFGPAELSGGKQGDYVDAPWGRLRWMGPVQPSVATDYEQGFLLRGAYDRPLDALQGDAIVPDAGTATVHLESMYLDQGFIVAPAARAAHTVSLLLSGSPELEVEMSGTLILDPNQCTLDDFGDRQGCTRIATRPVQVTVVRQRLADPANLGRRFFEVRGEDLPTMTFILHGTLQRCYLKLDRQLVPLYVHGA